MDALWKERKKPIALQYDGAASGVGVEAQLMELARRGDLRAMKALLAQEQQREEQEECGGDGLLVMREESFGPVVGIMKVKDNIIDQLEKQPADVKASIGNKPGGEGYVLAHPTGDIKFVNRAGFSAANRAVQR